MIQDLFQIRLQNGNSVIVQAEDPEKALIAAGISDLTSQCRQLRNPDSPDAEDAEILWELVEQAGIGLQNYTVRRLRNFMLDCKLNDDGSFTLSHSEEASLVEFREDYPELSYVPDGPPWASMMREAVTTERNRLTALFIGEQSDE